MIRELVWLEIQKNPGSSTRQIEEALGKPKSTVTPSIAQLLKAKLIRRRRMRHPSTNACGVVAYYVFYVTQETYTWATTRRGPVPKQPPNDESMEVWITQLPNLKVSEILKLRTAIDEVLSV